MNTHVSKLAALVLAFAGTAGCQHGESNNEATLSYVKPGLIMIPADQAHLYRLGTTFDCQSGAGDNMSSPLTVDSVQHGSVVSALQFNRYADPVRPNELMHEAHIVYRRESNPRWRLANGGRNEQILIGPQLTDGRGEIQALASQEISAFLQEQRTFHAQQKQLIAGFSEGVQKVSEQHQRLAEEVAHLKRTRQQAAEDETHAPTVGPEREPPPSNLLQKPREADGL